MTDSPAPVMRAALESFFPLEDSRLRFMKQLGVDDVLVWGNTLQPLEPGEDPRKRRSRPIPVATFARLREQAEAHGLRIFGVENLPLHFFDAVMFGEPDRDRQIEVYQQTLVNLAAAGIRNFGYNWIPDGVKRTSYTHPVRGGALGTAFARAAAGDVPLLRGRVFPREEFYANYRYFIERVLPVAEAHGVTLSIHPNDPPVESYGGVPHLFNSLAAYDEIFAALPSRFHQFTFCLGNIEEMGEDPVAAIRRYGPQGKIHYVHFQSVNGSVPDFHEAFIYTGDHDPAAIVAALDEVGFTGIMIPGHTPQIEGDVEWRPELSRQQTPYKHPMGGFRARAYTVGFMRGLLAARRLRPAPPAPPRDA